MEEPITNFKVSTVEYKINDFHYLNKVRVYITMQTDKWFYQIPVNTNQRNILPEQVLCRLTNQLCIVNLERRNFPNATLIKGKVQPVMVQFIGW